jgi:outer membrane protein OmpA-like peptidoglycan-associated protein
MAHAQSGPGANIDLQGFRPAMDSRGYITVNASQVLGHKELSFGLVTNWGRNLLVFENGDNHYRVEHMLTPTLVGALGLRLGALGLELGMSLPFGVMAGDRDPDTLGVPDDPNDDMSHSFDGQGIGDIGAHIKLRLANTSSGPKIGVAVVGSLYLPTASTSNSWLGSGSLTPQAMLVIDKEIGPFKMAVNGGIRLQSGVNRFEDTMTMAPDGSPQPSTGQAIAVGPTVPVGAGIAYALSPQRFDIVAEVFGQIPLQGENFMPVEAVGGIKLYLAKNSFLTLGGGAGLLPGRGGNPDVRAFMGIVFEPSIGDRDGDGIKDDVDGCPDDPEDYDDFADADGCPELDNDRDGILDVDDQCPNEPEDKDGYEDEDGCPEGNEFDRDGDGILDDDDECPDDPEDLDGFQDQDGCPDGDNDGDGILDVDDLCPDDPEDIDQWEDEDGCPDADNDNDRILDEDDECPNEPEKYNTYKDEDGCPDRGKVDFDGSKMYVMEKIYFEYNSAVIKQQSHAILRTVAQTLQLNPDLALLEIQGHTDERGTDEYNLRLSQSRAESVRNFLIDEGVAAERLEARGYGERMPLEPHSNQQAWAKNRRVEFVIIKRGDE